MPQSNQTRWISMKDSDSRYQGYLALPPSGRPSWPRMPRVSVLPSLPGRL